MGLMLGPMGLFVGTNAHPWGSFWMMLIPVGLLLGAMLQPVVSPHNPRGGNAIAFLTSKISPASNPRHLSTFLSPMPPLGEPAGGAELLHQAPLLSLRGCNAGKAGAGARCRNLPRLVLFQQDFQVPAVPAEPRRVGLGWAGLQ